MVAVATVAATLLQGLYYPEAYAAGSILIWVAVLVGLLSRALPLREVAAPARFAGICLAGIVVLSVASIVWAGDQGRAFEYGVRVSAYLGLFTLAACIAADRARTQWIAGLTVGLGIVSALSVASWLQPGLLGDADVAETIPNAAGRLSYPLGYWNALGALLAAATLLLGYTGASASERRLRAAAIAAIPVAVLGLWFTTSRGAGFALLAGLAVLIATSGDRVRQLLACVIGFGGAGVAIAATAGMDALSRGLADQAARTEGDWASLILLAVVALTGIAALLLDRLQLRLRVSRPLAVGLTALGAVVIGAAVVLADPAERLREFKQPPEGPPGTPAAAAGGIDLSGSGRWQLWGEAIDAFESAPIEGVGAGGYEDWWARHAPIGLFARNPHSLPLQQLAELGVLGALLMLGALGAVAVAAYTRLRAGRAGDHGVLLAVAVSGGVAAALDWGWEFPAVFGPAAVAAGLLTASGPGRQVSDRGTYALGLGTIALAWVAVVAAALVVLTELKLEQSRRASESGDVVEALARAEEARTVQPWSPEPYLQLALLEERRGHLDAALAYLKQAEARDSEDWRLIGIEFRLRGKWRRAQGLSAFGGPPESSVDWVELRTTSR